MHSGSRYLILTGISFGFISMLYFLSLALSVPFVVAALLTLVGVVAMWTWALKRNGSGNGWDSNTKWTLGLLVAGMALMVWNVCPLAEKYGGWDAWSVWNAHARYLASGAGKWDRYFFNKVDHPDYPLLLPGVNGFFIRLFQGDGAAIVPFVTGFCITLFVPVLLFLEHVKKNIVIAGILLLLLARDTFYLTWGMSQYADLALGFFFLCAMISIAHEKENPVNVAITAACLGCCIWTKNEGVILASLFIVFHLQALFSRRNALYFLGGIAMPLIAFFVFKVGYAPANDMVATQGHATYDFLFVGSRYGIIADHYVRNIHTSFAYLEVGLCAYLICCIVQRRMPSKLLFMLVVCTLAYMLIYVVTYHQLVWHLETSQSRLILQLVPAILYVFAGKLSELQIRLPEQALR